MVAAFAGVAAVSVVQHQRTASTLSLLNKGYLPLSSTISAASATQIAVNIIVDRPREADSAASYEWLKVARQIRPTTLKQALGAAATTGRLAKQPRDKDVVLIISAELEAALLEYELAEDDYETLSGSGPFRDAAAALAARQSVRTREKAAGAHLDRALLAVRERIGATTTAAREDERRAIGLLVGMGMVALALGLAVAWWSQRLLAPLPRLQERVAAVARGELDARLQHHADDEIGVVAAEFERMVDALGQRDEKLRSTERLAAFGKLAAHVTHEVRNPLNSIRLNVEMLEEDLQEAAPESKSLIGSITREVERLTSITEQYLRLVRLPEPALERGSLGLLARELSAFVRPEMERADTDLQLDIEEDLPDVAMDEGQLRQALLNLLRNAREAMPEGGKARLQLHAAQGGVVLRLHDQGSGIPSEERETIFDMFYTTKQHGTGLGLPLTQQVVVAHGGRIACKEADGGGTCFEIWLPACAPKQTPAAAAPGDGEAGGGETGQLAERST